MNAVRLYTPQVLALAASLANYRLLNGPDVRHGQARSATCGSMVEISVVLDEAGRIDRLGLRAQACAIGQAAAAVFAAAAAGRTAVLLDQDIARLQDWLMHDGPVPDWPGLDQLAAARDYPARHSALQLAWIAARTALATAPSGS